MATTDTSVHKYLQKTFLYRSQNHEKLFSMVNLILCELEETKLVERRPQSEYTATLLGQAIVASCLNPDDGLFVHRELRRALTAFVMDGDMHAIYLFTPAPVSSASINWQIFRSEVEALDENNMKAVTFIGLSLSTVNKM